MLVAMNYKEKLKDPRWQKKRLEIMQRDNFTCQICGATDKPLVVHHKSYKRCHGEPWRCPDSDLITICEDCHDNEHKRLPEKPLFNNTKKSITMTKNEFILKTIISMAGGNDVVDIVLATCLTNRQINRIIEDAQRIADATEMFCRFDKENNLKTRGQHTAKRK